MTLVLVVVTLVVVVALEGLRRRHAAALDPVWTAADRARLAALPCIIDHEERQPQLDQRHTGTVPVDRKALKSALRFTHRGRGATLARTRRRLRVVPLRRNA